MQQRKSNEKNACDVDCLNLSSAFQRFCLQQKEHTRFWIAYSGGMDSHVLLSLAANLKEQFNFTVIHINHHLSPHADEWEKHCQSIVADFQLSLDIHHVHLAQNDSASLEELARDARYHIFKSVMQPNDILLTAHHQNDQTETVLLQLLRGAGPKGLSAMPKQKKLGKGWLARPLLSYSRQQLRDYAAQHALNWIEDESNQNIRFSRNYLRNDIMPALLKHWPGALETITRSASHCAEMQTLNEELLQEVYLNSQGSESKTLSVKRLMHLSPLKQRAVLRYWISKHTDRMPSTEKLITIQKCVLTAAVDRFPSVKWKNMSVRRFKDNLYLVPLATSHAADQIIPWSENQPIISITGIGQFQTHQPLPAETSIRFRKGGESITICGRGNRTLKNLFQEWEVPTWIRDRVPLVYVGEKLMGAIGYYLPEELNISVVMPA